MLHSALSEPGQQRVEIGRPSIAEADVRLYVTQVIGSGVLPITILGERPGWHSQLESQVGTSIAPWAQLSRNLRRRFSASVPQCRPRVR